MTNPKRREKMKLIESTKNGMVEIKTIENIVGLENHQIVMMERGDSLKKVLKKAAKVGGYKDHHSIKTIKAAIKDAAAKQNKKNNTTGNCCCVCTDWFQDAVLDARGICPHCQLI